MRALLQAHWQTSTQNLSTQGNARAALLTELRVLRFDGADVHSFLQGYLTTDLDKLDEQHYQLCALTSLKGRVVASGWCVSPGPGRVDWVIHHSLTDAVLAFLKPYLAFAKTTATCRQDDHLIAGVWDAGTAPGTMPEKMTGTRPSIRVLDSNEAIDQLLQDHQPDDPSGWQTACHRAGLALVTEAISDQFLPQMLGLVRLDAVDFDKGCYLGQEVVARAQHRGQVKRRLAMLTTAAMDTAPRDGLQPGQGLMNADGKEIGTLVSALSGDTTDSLSGAASKPFTGLAVLREPAPVTVMAADLLLDVQSFADSER